MISVERVLKYTRLSREPLNIGKMRMRSEWPYKGRIAFNNVSLKLENNGPKVLKNLSVNINPGDKLGIIERPGSGKSSIVQSIVRLYEPDGDLMIDYVNVKELSLINLRSHLSIINVIKLKCFNWRKILIIIRSYFY